MCSFGAAASRVLNGLCLPPVLPCSAIFCRSIRHPATTHTANGGSQTHQSGSLSWTGLDPPVPRAFCFQLGSFPLTSSRLAGRRLDHNLKKREQGTDSISAIPSPALSCLDFSWQKNTTLTNVDSGFPVLPRLYGVLFAYFRAKRGAIAPVAFFLPQSRGLISIISRRNAPDGITTPHE